MPKAKLRDSTDSLGLPDNFEVGKAMDEEGCFFDSVAQGLKQLKPTTDFTAKSLRSVCKDLAAGDKELKSKVVRDARKNDDSLRDHDLLNAYLANIEYTNNDLEEIEDENPDSYQSLRSSKYGDTLKVPIQGRPDIEGQMICRKYSIKLHIAEKSTELEEWSHQIVDKSGSRTSQADYNDANTVHIIKDANHFKPILSTKKTRHDGYKVGIGSSELEDYLSDIDKTIEKIREDESFGEIKFYKKGESKLCNLLGELYDRYSNILIDGYGRFYLLHQVGSTYHELNHREESVHFLEAALYFYEDSEEFEIANAIDDNYEVAQELAFVYEELAFIYGELAYHSGDLKDYTKLTSYLEKELNLHEEYGDKDYTKLTSYLEKELNLHGRIWR